MTARFVIHELSSGSSDSSVAYIENGHISGRKIGDGPLEAVLNAMRHQDGVLSDRLAYLTKTDNGHILKSSTIYIRDESQKIHYILSINSDITNLLALENTLHALTSCAETDKSKTKSDSPQRITLSKTRKQSSKMPDCSPFAEPCSTGELSGLNVIR